MPREPRPYQERAHAGVLRAWQDVRSVCLVAPTGAGKTFMSVRLALEPGGTVLWSAHRRELVKQAYASLHGEVGGAALSIIAPGHKLERGARIQVSSTQTLVSRGKPDIEPPAVIVLDEFHHYAAEEFGKLTEWWPNAKILGPTATPQRGDGKPLGDISQRLVVAAEYSELIADGFLCDAVCYQPPEYVQGGLANDPVSMWQRYSQGMRGFAFCKSVKAARELADAFNRVGIPAACIDAKTPKPERDDTLARFASGDLQVIANVDTMTEGVDVPAAGVCMLAKPYESVGPYLQAGGRVLRPHSSKKHAIIIDLVGATIVHGPPVIDRAYSLSGDGIAKGDGGGAENPVRNCLKCGLIYLCALDACPDCGCPKPLRVKRPDRIYSLELQEVWAGENTRDDAKKREYERLRKVAREQGHRIWWVIKQYKVLFGDAPKLYDVTPKEKRDEFYALRRDGDRMGRKVSYAAGRFKDLFGHWPAGF